MRLKLSILILVSLACMALQFPFPGGHSANGAIAADIGPVDAYLDVASAGQTNGTAITPTILNSGTIGIANTGNWALSASSGMTVAAHQSSCALLGALRVNGTAYPTSHTTQSIDYDHANATKTADLTIPLATGPVGYTQATITGCIIFGPASVSPGSTGLFDYIFIRTSSAAYVTVQLNNGDCGGGGIYAVNIEGNPGGVTSHSSCTSALSPTGTYWFSFQYDSAAGLGSLNWYDSTGSQIGSTITRTTGTGVIDLIRIGNNEAGTSPGNHSKIENIVVRYSGGSPFPLGPINTTQAPVYWAGQSHNNKTTAGTSVSTTKTLDVPSGYGMVVSCSNENASGQTTSVTNTAGDTFTSAASVKSAGNGQSISQWIAYAAANRTNQTFTCNFPSSSFSNIDVQLISGSTAFDIGAVGNKASGADSTTGSFTPTTSTGANIYCAYIQNSVAIGQGTNYQMLNTSATNSMGCGLRTNAPNTSQTATGTHSDTSASMIVVGNYK